MKFLASALVLLTPALASAHPGHGSVPGDALAHWVAEPAHASGLVLALGLVAFLAVRLARSANR